jgi:hypothetical protein
MSKGDKMKPTVGVKVRRLCKRGLELSHSKAREILPQLKKNPEVCEKCRIRPCILVKYLYS